MRTKLGRARVPVVLGLAGLLALAIGVPVYALVHWFVQGTSSTLPPVSVFHAVLWTAGYSAAAAAIATAAAVPVALLVERHRSTVSVVIERSTYLVQALPGIVIALSFAYFSLRYAFSLYQSSLELVLAYVIMFFPLALVAVRAGVAQAPPGLEEVARSLGHRRLSVLRRVTLPILAPSLAAGFSLVFIGASTELTATLSLHPTGVQTLATDFWEYQRDFAYGAAAPYALGAPARRHDPGASARPLVRTRRGGSRRDERAGIRLGLDRGPPQVVRLEAGARRRLARGRRRLAHRDPRRLRQRQDDAASPARRLRAA